MVTCRGWCLQFANRHDDVEEWLVMRWGEVKFTGTLDECCEWLRSVMNE